MKSAVIISYVLTLPCVLINHASAFHHFGSTARMSTTRKRVSKHVVGQYKNFWGNTKRNRLAPVAIRRSLVSDDSKLHYSDSSDHDKMDWNEKFRIFCDLDGVLCDFDAGVRSLSKGVPADNLPTGYMWSLIAKADRFYERLPWTPDGRALWEALRPLQPNILTGVSRGKTCPDEKANWCRRELGEKTNHVCKAARLNNHQIVRGHYREGLVNVITCWSKNKHFESGPQAVLIDDRVSLEADWVSKGGIFIHHISTERTIEKLRSHGILPGDGVQIVDQLKRKAAFARIQH